MDRQRRPLVPPRVFPVLIEPLRRSKKGIKRGQIYYSRSFRGLPRFRFSMRRPMIAWTSSVKRSLPVTSPLQRLKYQLLFSNWNNTLYEVSVTRRPLAGRIPQCQITRIDV